MGRLAKLQQQVELLGEQVIIVPPIQAEQRKGLGERTSADDDFSAAFRDQIKRRELLKDAYGVSGAQDSHRAREADLAWCGPRLRPE